MLSNFKTCYTKSYQFIQCHASVCHYPLHNSEIWYGLNQSDINQLEEVDKLLLRRVFETSSSSCIESFYLELGIIPIHIIIMARRVKYLHYLVNLKEDEMLFNVFSTQWKYPARDDWTIQVQNDMKKLNINMNWEEMKMMSTQSFKRLVKIKTKEVTLDYLLTIKEKHKKMENLKYTELKMQKYLKDKDIPVHEARNLYKYRTRSAHFKENLKGSYLSTACPLCFVQLDTQEHSFQCPVVKSQVEI